MSMITNIKTMLIHLNLNQADDLLMSLKELVTSQL